MAVLGAGVAGGAEEEDAVVGQAGLVCGGAGGGEQGRDGDEGAGARVGELAGELVDGVGWVGRAGDAAGPEEA